MSIGILHDFFPTEIGLDVFTKCSFNEYEHRISLLTS